jgi:lipopolysaccharide transport system ATP-binding protein
VIYTAEVEEIYKPSLRFKDEQGNFIFVSGSDHSFAQTRANKKLTMSVPSRFFNQGTFYLDIQISDGRKLHFRAEDVIAFTVIQEESKLGQWMGKTVGPLKPKFDWNEF